VPQEHSGWILRNAGKEATVAEHGSFWADPQSGMVYRLWVIAGPIPRSVGIQAADVDIRYGETRLVSQHRAAVAVGDVKAYLSSDNRPLLLPQSFSVNVVLESGEDNRNDVSFTHCREYNSESKLVVTEAPKDEVKEFSLPSSLTVKVKLVTPLQSFYNRVGDRVQAKVEQDVLRNGRLVLPREAELVGRVRRLEHYTSPREWICALEFTEVAFAEDGQIVHSGFFGRLRSYDRTAGVDPPTPADVAGELPSVGTFMAEGRNFSLKAGFRMTWTTTVLRK
jgi:hypothetical protein